MSKENQKIRFLEGSITKAVVSLAIPTTISQLVTVLYNMADTYFVAQIGTNAAAAVGVVFSIMSLIQAIGFGLGMGSSSIISRKLGAGKKTEADRVGSSAVAAAFLFGLFLDMICLPWLSKLLNLLGAKKEVLSFAFPYALLILLVAPFMCASFVLTALLRAEGDATLSMIGLCFGGILNIILDPLFIFSFHLGIVGAGVATGLSQCISFTIILYFFLSHKTIVQIQIKNISKNPSTYKNIILTGIPTICRQGLGSLSTAVLNIQAAAFGNAALAAISIFSKIYMLIRNIILGIGQGYQPVAGYNYGADQNKRVKKSFLVACTIGTGFGFIFFIVLFLFPNTIMNYFCHNDQKALDYGTRALWIASLEMPFLAYSTYVNQLFQCLGFSKQATFLASCRQGIFFLPLIYILPCFLGFAGIQSTQPLADFMTFLISVPFQIYFFKKELKV